MASIYYEFGFKLDKCYTYSTYSGSVNHLSQFGKTKLKASTSLFNYFSEAP